MQIHVLGSAAGGGFPQWNCGCATCRGVRTGTLRTLARTQESVAVSNDGEGWFILNASPDICQQIEAFRPLHPRGLRESPIQAILLTNGDLDHCLGLLSLRESYPLVIYATERVREGFTKGNNLYHTLERFPEQVTWRLLRLGSEDALVGKGNQPSGLVVRAVAVPGKLPIHLDGCYPPHAEDNVGLCRLWARIMRDFPWRASPDRCKRRTDSPVAARGSRFYGSAPRRNRPGVRRCWH